MRSSLLKVLAATVISGMLVSCSKSDVPSAGTPDGKPINKLEVSESFMWEASRLTILEIGTDMVQSSGEMVLVKVYDGDPEQQANLLLAGSSGYGLPFKSVIRIPASLTRLWVEAQGNNGNKQMAIVDVAESIKYNFTEPVNGYKSAHSQASFEPPCSGDITISGNTQVTIQNGKTYLIEGSYSGNLNFNSSQGGGTLIICGNANLNALNLDNLCKVVVTSSGVLNCSNLTQSGTSEFEAWGNTTVTIGQFNQNGPACSFTNYSNNLSISYSVAAGAKIFNFGSMNIAGTLNLNSNGAFYNSGNLTIGGSLNINQDFVNEGTTTVNQAINFNTSNTYVNNCEIIAGGNVNLNAGTLTFTEGYMQVPSFTVNGSGNLKLVNKSMLTAGTLMVNNAISAIGARSSIVTTGNVTINGGRKIDGPLEWADNDKILLNGSTADFINGATFVKTENAINVIAASPCNPTGFGVPVNPDSDADGVYDSQDAYPQDASRAFNSYYPNQSGWASLAFEDLWPAAGDYDFNDMVIKYRYQTITNASNKVVELKASYQVTAVGAGYVNGFGIQFDNLSPQLIASVNGQVSGEEYIHFSPNGTEASQPKAVIIPWDNVDKVIHRNGGATFNTTEGTTPGTSDVVEVSILFTTPVDIALLGNAPYNPFLIREMKRGHEIHLADHLPTALMDMSLMGTFSDHSKPAQGRYFRNDRNLPWAISIPEVLEHPLEKTMISDAYLKFSAWAESGAALYNDWYQKKLGYRNETKIY